MPISIRNPRRKVARFPTPRAHGFTLVEILIVVIILGILAAIVVPQFASASQDARKNALISQLQTLRSQTALYALQHRDKFPTDLSAGGAGETPWVLLTSRTDVNHNVSSTGPYGPYLQGAPINPLNGSSAVDTSFTADLGAGGVANPGSAAAGWLFNPTIGKIWATSAKGGYVFDEGNPNNATNFSE